MMNAGASKTASLLLSVAVITAVNAMARAQDAPSPVAERPSYEFLRQYEDWSVVRGADPETLDDFWDPIKYVPLSDDGEIWGSFGGQARLRFEGWSSFNFDPDEDGAFGLWRLLLHGDVHFGEHLRVFAQAKSALSTDRDLPGGRRALDVDTIDLEQAFVDLKLPLSNEASITIRPGRQAFLFGKQRLVSPLAWSNTLRRWDGISTIARVGEWRIDGFWSQFVPVDKYGFNQADAQTEFFGVYATGAFPWVDGLGLDLYFLGLHKDDLITFNGSTGNEDRYTLGGRFFGNLVGTSFDYDLEGAYQFGKVGSGDVSAFMLGSEFGYKLAAVGSSPRLFVGFDYGSGDDASGGDVGTFNQIFPLGHAFLGYMDFVGRQNIVALDFGASCRPVGSVTLRLTGHLFWRADTADALYDAGGSVLRPGSLSDAREVGQEIDLTVNWRINRHTIAEFGYGHFFTGAFISDTGSASDADFVYTQIQYTF